MTLTFAETHNMVAYLTKSDASDGFNQIIDFLNVSSIKYALTVNPNIYVSCIKQFWTTIGVKNVNDIIRLQALVDKKKVVVTKATIREVLRLDDAEGVECLPNEEIFTELARMGYEKPSTKLMFYKAFFSSQLKFLIHTILQCMSAKRTSWNEFSSSMTSAVICLSSGKGFSGIETSLFEGMLVAQVVGEGVANEVHDEGVPAAGFATERDVSATNDEVPTVAEEPSILSPTPPTPPPQPSHDIPSTFLSTTNTTTITSALSRRVEHLELDKIAQALEITELKRRVKKLERRNKVKVLKLRRLQKVRTIQRVETSDETVLDDVSNQERMIAKIDQDADIVLEDDKEFDDKEVADDVKDDDESEPGEVQEVVDVVTTAKIITEVVTAASEIITAASTTITAAEAQVPAVTLTAAPARVTAAPSRRRKGDKGKGILVEEPKPLKKQQQIKKDEKYARKLEAELNKNIDWDEFIDHVKRKAKEDPAVKKYQDLKRKPQNEAQARKHRMLYLKNVAGFKIDYFKGISYDDIQEESKALKRINKTPTKKSAKKKKLDEEVEELKRHLQIVPNEDDDVYTEATPLARKVPVVDYEIIEQNNKPYYKIIRADGIHQLHISFMTLLRNFNREDLEALWSLVKEKFSTTKPKNFFDDFLLVTLGAMFEKPDIHAQIWKNQRSVHGPAKVKVGSYWNHVMLNAVRLKVKEESKVSLELLRKQEEKRIEEEQAANAQYWKIPACCDDDDDYNSVITPNKLVDSLSMGDAHLNTILATKSDEFIKSCVKNLVPNPNESEGENGCDVPACFATFSNILFDADYESNSSDYQSCSDEDFPEEIFSNPLFEKEIIPMKIDQHHFNAEYDLIESMLNHDSSIIPSSLKIDSLLDEFAGELTLLKSISPGIDETDCYPEEDIRLIERFLYDNSSPRPPKEFVSDNFEADIKSFSLFPIPLEDSDSHMEEIDLPFTPDDPMSLGIKEDDYDSEMDVLILKEFLDNYSLSLPVIKSYHFDIPSFFRPLRKPQDGNTRILNIKMMGDISEQKYSQKCEDSCQRILSSKFSFPRLQLGIMYPNLID
nr:hypothetical protein [Tanacetum cinerariifolium]